MLIKGLGIDSLCQPHLNAFQGTLLKITLQLLEVDALIEYDSVKLEAIGSASDLQVIFSGLWKLNRHPRLIAFKIKLAIECEFILASSYEFMKSGDRFLSSKLRRVRKADPRVIRLVAWHAVWLTHVPFHGVASCRFYLERSLDPMRCHFREAVGPVVEQIAATRSGVAFRKLPA
ncbi:hypothetical protein MFFC18_06550 [Mariniblastus fucicola]|uniref:Uncharacterized protein n=1 Tax=Mariniblastus fucicola TaxID=980251 RepID=A0A5B9P3N2_9BACT|nr:hypothetical protein MFFC18_06550 [Mariniblastus fucicola]